MTEKLLNVHEIVTDAIIANEPTKDTAIHIKLETELKEQAEAILARHGTNYSKFLRQCLYTLVKEYVEG